jgi:hypothetical protein
VFEAITVHTLGYSSEQTVATPDHVTHFLEGLNSFTPPVVEHFIFDLLSLAVDLCLLVWRNSDLIIPHVICLLIELLNAVLIQIFHSLDVCVLSNLSDVLRLALVLSRLILKPDPLEEVVDEGDQLGEDTSAQVKHDSSDQRIADVCDHFWVSDKVIEQELVVAKNDNVHLLEPFPSSVMGSSSVVMGDEHTHSHVDKHKDHHLHLGVVGPIH